MDKFKIATLSQSASSGFDVYLKANDIIIMLLDTDEEEDENVKQYKINLAQGFARIVKNPI